MVLSLQPIRRSLFAKKTPRVIYAYGKNAAATSVTTDLPYRGKGLLHLMVAIRANGGTNTPSNPTGWTSLFTSGAAPNCRISYLFSDGSEAYTYTTSAGGASNMVAHTYTIEGVDPSIVPTINTENTTDFDPTSATPSTIGKDYLYIAYLMWRNVGLVVTEWPRGYHDFKLQNGTANGGIATGVKYPDVYKTEDPTAFSMSGAPSASRCGFIMVPGFKP